MAKAKKPDLDAAGELDWKQMRIRVSAPAGPRRRAGHSFTEVARTLTLGELAEDFEVATEMVKTLQADPYLSVVPVIDEGSIEPAEGDSQA